MGRIIAIDYGTKRTGIAVSDPLRLIAGGLETVPTHHVVEFLREYTTANEVDTIVLGKPARMDGSPSDTWPGVEALARRLGKEFPGIRVDFFDERFTSVLAHRAMLDAGLGRMKRRDKALVDKISATIILQGYMESRG